ncbi:unnamed protein product, partial [Rotaria magnacalcarata]
LKDQEKFEKLVYTLINAIKMKIKSDGMNPEMNDPMPYNFREQSEPNIGDPYGKLPLHYLKAQAAGGDSNEKQMKHTEDMNDKKSLITSHLNQTYGPGNGNTRGTLSFLFSSYKGEPWTTTGTHFQHQIIIQIVYHMNNNKIFNIKYFFFNKLFFYLK